MQSNEYNDWCELNRNFKNIDFIYHEIALKNNLTDSEFDIYYSLYVLGDGCLQKDVCTVSYSSKQTINSTVKKLEKSGHIRLEQGSGRQKHIFLNQSAKEIIDGKIQSIADAELATLQAMSADERAELLRLMNKYSEILMKKFKLEP